MKSTRTIRHINAESGYPVSTQGFDDDALYCTISKLMKGWLLLAGSLKFTSSARIRPWFVSSKLMTGISPLWRTSMSSSRGVIVTTGMGTCVSNVASSVILYTSSNVTRFTTQLKCTNKRVTCVNVAGFSGQFCMNKYNMSLHVMALQQHVCEGFSSVVGRVSPIWEDYTNSCRRNVVTNIESWIFHFT